MNTLTVSFHQTVNYFCPGSELSCTERFYTSDEFRDCSEAVFLCVPQTECSNLFKHFSTTDTVNTYAS